MDEKSPAYPMVHLADFEPIPEDILAIFPVGLVRRSLIVPVARRGDRVIAVVPKTEGIIKPEGLRLVAGCPVDLAIAPLEEIIAFIEKNYPPGEDSRASSPFFKEEIKPGTKVEIRREPQEIQRIPEASRSSGEIGPGSESRSGGEHDLGSEHKPVIERDLAKEEDREGEKEGTSRKTEARETEPEIPAEPGIPSILQTIVEEAVKHRAREILVEQKKENFRFRQRIKGVLLSQGPWHKWNQSEFLEMIFAARSFGESFTQAGIKWTEVRRAVAVGGEKFSVLFKLSETVDQNVLSIHIYPHQEKSFSPTEWGMDVAQAKLFESLLNQFRGMLVFCGVEQDNVGETMRNCLRKMATPDKHVMMVENRLEEWLPDIDQFSANGDEKLFGELLKVNLRHLPDLLMVDPLSKKDHLETCLRFALDGSRIFGRFFAWDAVDALAQLLSMGIDPHLLRYGISGFVTQRTLRMNCPRCQKKDEMRREQTKEIGVPIELVPPYFFRGDGCDSCHQTGFDREVDIFEVVILTEELKKQIGPDFKAEKIRTAIKSEGMFTLRQIALRKAIDGQTSLAEVIRTTLK